MLLWNISTYTEVFVSLCGEKSTLGKKAVCTKGEAAFERFLFAQTVNQ